MFKLVYASQEESDKIESEFGGFNDFPPGWREIDVAEFAQRMSSYHPMYHEYRQMLTPERNVPAVSAQLFFYHDGTGVAVVSNWGPTDPDIRYSPYVWTGRVFAFGCNHEYESIGIETLREVAPEFKTRLLFRTEHASRCTKCGHIKIVDSSD